MPNIGSAVVVSHTAPLLEPIWRWLQVHGADPMGLVCDGALIARQLSTPMASAVAAVLQQMGGALLCIDWLLLPVMQAVLGVMAFGTEEVAQGHQLLQV